MKAAQDVQKLTKQLDRLDIQAQKSIAAIRAINELEVGATVMVPVTDGLFVEAKITADSYKVFLGADVVGEKSKEDTLALLKKELQEITKQQRQVEATLQQIEQQLGADHV